MRNLLVICGIFIWLMVAFVWLFPLRRQLEKIHGVKSHSFFAGLAKNGDPLVKQLKWRTRVFIVAGLVGGALIIMTK